MGAKDENVVGLTAADELQIGVLGPLDASRAGLPVTLGGRRQRTVLAILLLARGSMVSADQLIETVWDGRPPAAALSTLHAYLSRLRTALDPARVGSGGSVILSVGPGYALRLPAAAVDAWRFETSIRAPTTAEEPGAVERRLEAALALWRGPTYAEFTDETWTQAERGRLEELREAARDELALARLTLGRHTVVVPELEAMVAASPLREERWRMLVLALYRSDRQSDALAALRRVRKVLSDEIGVEPGPALQALEAEVLAHSASLQQVRATAPGPALSLGGSTHVAVLAPALDDLVDRDAEVAELRHAFEQAKSGDARLVLLRGPAGIGKTRLLSEARLLAREGGAQVLVARGSLLEKEYGYGMVRALFEATVVGNTAADALLRGPAAAAAPVFDLVGGAGPVGSDSNPSVVHGLYRLAASLTAAGPVVVCIDDLQWCDTASLRFLAYLVHRAEGLPLLIAATVRTGEVHTDDLILDALAQDPITLDIKPGPLTRSGVAEVIRSQLGASVEDEFVTACFDTTSGNPLLLRQLLRAVASEQVPPDAAHAGLVTTIGSRAVSSLVLSRLARMPPDCTAVASAVAVLGTGAALPAVAAIAEVEEPRTAVTVAALARAEILRNEYPLGFVHGLVADAVYHDLAPGRRQLWHDRAAHVLDAAGASPEQVAAHLLQVPPRRDPWVVDTLRRAASRARERAVPEVAAAMLARALTEPPRTEDRAAVLLDLGQAEAISEAPAATAHLREAYELLDDPAGTFELALTLARTLVFVGVPGAASGFAREAANRLPAELSDQRQALVATERISGYLHDLDPAAWRREPIEDVVGDGPGARMLAAELAWEAVIDGVDRQRAIDLVRFAVADGSLLDADTGLLWVIAGQVLDLCDEDSAPLWSAGLIQARRRGDLFTTLGMQLWRGFMLWGRGDLREASQVLVAGNEMSHSWGAGGTASGYGEAFLLGVRIDQGDLGPAREYLEQIRPHPRFAEGARMFGFLHARLLVAEGRPLEALDQLDAVADLMSGVRNPAWRPWRSARAAALAGLGRRSEAVALLDAELELARGWGAARTIGRVLRLRGQVRGADGVVDLREAVELLTPERAQVELGRSLLALAQRSPDDDAVPLLRRALDLAGLSGANALYRATGRELRRHRIVVDAAPPPTMTLSGTERRILQRHLAGVDAREIAEELALTPRSVRGAIGSARQRLGASDDDELRQALATSPDGHPTWTAHVSA